MSGGSHSFSAHHPSPLGILQIAGDEAGIHKVRFVDAMPAGPAGTRGPGLTATEREPPVLTLCRLELDAYFAGTLQAFTVTLTPTGTPFQRRVWRALAGIAYGRTTTYGAIAGALGDPKTVRAVGAANGANPIAILIPCHRVIGRDGALVGYAGGLDRKRALLKLEGVGNPLF